MTRFKYIYLLLSSIVLFAACNEAQQKPIEPVNPETYKEPLANVNKKLVKNEEQDINNLIERYNWDMIKTGTGLRYMIYKKGNGSKVEKNKIATISFEVRLITGDICYSSKEEGLKELLIGKSGDISGLEEGLLLMKAGDRAKFIIPSYLAYGLLGDDNKIPKRATLIYDVELLNVK